MVRVAAGGFGELLNVPVGNVYAIPESKLADEFWLVEPVACVVNGMDRCGVRVGDRVAFVGCGYMGMMFLQTMAHMAVVDIIAIDIYPKKLNLAKKSGATQADNPTDKNFREIEEQLFKSGHRRGGRFNRCRKRFANFNPHRPQWRRNQPIRLESRDDFGGWRCLVSNT